MSRSRVHPVRSPLVLTLVAALTLGSPSQAFAADKAELYREMEDLARQLSGDRSRATSGTDAAARAAMAKRYDELSARLGGDDPGHLGTAASRVATVRPLDGPAPDGVCCLEPTGVPQVPPPPAAPTGGPTVLTFEGLQNSEPINEFYNGGLGGSGSGPGPDFDVSFTATSLALIDSDAGGSGNFGGEPSPDTGLFFLTGSAIMNVPAGFTTGFSFFYSAINNPGSVSVYDGLNGTGTLLTTLPLPLTPNNGAPDPTGQFSPLVPIGVAFAGTALSVDFGGTVNQIVFDDVTLGSDVPGGGGNPPGCVASSVTVQGPGVTIPPSGTVTSTIVLAGLDPYLWDLDVQTFITHAFPTDLDITLTSPAGTVSTLTTDNGGSATNAFNGTLWDDSGGDTNPPGPPTDTTYAANVVETALALEEAMGAFIGEDPNGTWTLTITDDFAPDGGNLASWSMTLDTFAAPPTLGAPAPFTQNTPTPIPDLTTVTSTLVVSGVTGFCDVDLTTSIVHTFPGDLDITLTSPAGTVSTITTDNGSSAVNAFNGTVWDDDGGTANPPGAVTDTTFAANVVETTLVPEESMGTFLDEDPNGTWTITIVDDAGGDTGTLTSWTLTFAACACAGACQLTCPGDVVQANDAGICGAVVNYPAPVPTGQCGTVTCTPPSGGLFDVGTTGVTCTSSTGSPQAATYSSGNIAVRIPESGTAGNMVPVVLSVPPGGTVVDVDVRIRANHTFDGDLSIAMVGPDGVTTVSLAENRGGGGDNFGTGATDCTGTKTVFDDEAGTPIGSGSPPFAGSFIPETALAAFDGLPSGGDWTLTIVDEVGGDSGFLYCVDIVLTTLTPDGICTFNVTVNDVEPPVLTCPADIFQDLPPGVPSEPVVFGDPGVTDNCPNPGAPSCVPPSGSIFTAGTTPVACTAIDAAGNTGSCTFDVTLNAVSILEIPTASTWGLAALALLLAGLGLSLLRRRTIGTR